MMLRLPRPHQTTAIEKLRASFSSGKRRPMLMLPTGAGKTFTAALVIATALAKGKRVIFVVPALSLVDQTVLEFHREGITDIGVIQSDHWLTDYSKPVQVASVQTLARRGMPNGFDIVIVDEAHRMFEFICELMCSTEWASVLFIGLSATPWAKGLGKFYDDLIIGATTLQLINAGVLTMFIVFAPAHPDLTGVKTVAGDYHEGQLAEVMGALKLVAGIVSTWLDKGENRPTLCFAVDCAHAKKIQQEFLDADVGCGYIDAHTPREERAKIKAQLERGEIKVVCNVGTLTTGVDWDVRCIILARPTKSEILYVQMIGRGLRTAPDKENCIILDHSDNTLRMGFVTDIHHDKLCDGTRKSSAVKRKSKEKLPRECPACSYLKAPSIHTCPACGFEPVKQSAITETAGELQQVTGKKRDYALEEKQAWYSGFLYISEERGYSQGWAAYTFKEKFGVWPDRFHKTAIYPPIEVSNYAKAKLIRFAKRRHNNTKEQRVSC